MRIRLPEPSLTDELTEFLRRCDCAVTDLGDGVFDVQLELALSYDAAMNLIQAGRCYGCGQEIEPVLRDLGSALCHDCRDGENGNGPGHANLPADAALRERWVRMEVMAYLRTWSALHADAEPAVLD
jgi:hypothetical protein